MSTTYVVKSGDTLSEIASKYNVKGGYQALATYNGISNPNNISVGQKIKIPSTSTSSSSGNVTSSSTSGSSIGVGSKVKITGSKYATGQTIPSWVKSNTYTVSQISGSKALIKEIVSWVKLSDLQLVSGGVKSETKKEEPKKEEPKKETPKQEEAKKEEPKKEENKSSGSIGVGSTVKITGNKYATGQSIPSWVKAKTYTVSQMSGSKALLKEIVSWVYVSDLQLTSGGVTTKPDTGNKDTGGSKGSYDGSSLASSWVNFGSKNSNERKSKIRKITIHHMAGNMGATSCANMHKNGSASANYYIGTDGTIVGGVRENRRAWTSSNGDNDHQAITFEVANNSGAPNWTISNAAYNSMIALCRDICSRYGISAEYNGSSSGTLTTHKMFASTACPGPYIEGKLKNGQIAKDIKGG